MSHSSGPVAGSSHTAPASKCVVTNEQRLMGLPSRPLGKQVTRSREVLLLKSLPLSSPERAGDAATCGTFVYALFVQMLGQSLAGKIILLCLFTSGLENSLLPVSVGVWRRGAKISGGCVGHAGPCLLRWETPQAERATDLPSLPIRSLKAEGGFLRLLLPYRSSAEEYVVLERALQRIKQGGPATS